MFFAEFLFPIAIVANFFTTDINSDKISGNFTITLYDGQDNANVTYEGSGFANFDIDIGVDDLEIFSTIESTTADLAVSIVQSSIFSVNKGVL